MRLVSICGVKVKDFISILKIALIKLTPFM